MNGSALARTAEAVRAAAERRADRHRLSVQLQTAETLVARRRNELAALERTLQVERADVHALEHLSPTKIWSTLRGTTADRLAIERAEADAAQLAVSAAQTRLGSALADEARLRADRDALGQADRAYREALDAHEDALRAAGGREASALAELSAQVGVGEAHQREIDEAVVALREARAALHEALRSLGSAGGWATYDTFFGGGLIADLAKHSKIDESTGAFVEVNRALERLSIELADIGVTALDGVTISDTLAVFDVVFDNIVSDWMVKDRISQARADAESLSHRLDQLADELDAQSRRNQTHLTTLRGRREAILTGL
ncbi:hypothetical protein [Demequina zhanjiangensis]|uniref:Uncharacterized protein n=1 Tax=Demequina zhanjiangensis TaxID=3051659 RepID=A0ABT8G253_9MICO|nr:hypothetical protein [Demequina sp. SYSU T00b26]MDN4473220.1 hypothetical protein [Demequina sp. SYSU T00b26]